RLDEIKEAITKIDIRNLINQGIIKGKPYVGTSRFRARKRLIQKRKGRRYFVKYRMMYKFIQMISGLMRYLII
ncbi:MAG: hypothetical protein HYV28_14135, partial [Ignavibacteriales bacterium]|nr:hypothetical protein [Ignavibacteriales bacterium]